MKYLVLDTNVYIHYRDFEQIDWKALVGDDVTIAVPYYVLREIDKHKDQSRGKIQKKAKKISARFSDIFLMGQKSAIPVTELNNPPASAFDAPQYNKEICDDWIILSALYATIDKSDIVVVSGDNGILMRAKHCGLGFYKMPDSLLISEELSDEEKEIKRLRDELAKFTNRMPNPSVTFTNGSSTLTLTKPASRDIEAELQQYEMELRRSHPYKSYEINSQSNSVYDTLQRLTVSRSTPEQIDKYNKELDEYFDKMVKQKRTELTVDMLNHRIQEVPLWLLNSGNAQTGDTNIVITFPDEVHIYDESCKKDVVIVEYDEPVLQDNFTAFRTPAFGGSTYKNSKSVEKWILGTYLKDNTLFYSHSKLNHGMLNKLTYKKNLYVDAAQCGNFKIHWTVIDSNLIDEREGDVHVIVKEKQA